MSVRWRGAPPRRSWRPLHASAGPRARGGTRRGDARDGPQPLMRSGPSPAPAPLPRGMLREAVPSRPGTALPPQYAAHAAQRRYGERRRRRADGSRPAARSTRYRAVTRRSRRSSRRRRRSARNGAPAGSRPCSSSTPRAQVTACSRPSSPGYSVRSWLSAVRTGPLPPSIMAPPCPSAVTLAPAPPHRWCAARRAQSTMRHQDPPPTPWLVRAPWAPRACSTALSTPPGRAATVQGAAGPHDHCRTRRRHLRGAACISNSFSLLYLS